MQELRLHPQPRLLSPSHPSADGGLPCTGGDWHGRCHHGHEMHQLRERRQGDEGSDCHDGRHHLHGCRAVCTRRLLVDRTPDRDGFLQHYRGDKCKVRIRIRHFHRLGRRCLAAPGGRSPLLLLPGEDRLQRAPVPPGETHLQTSQLQRIRLVLLIDSSFTLSPRLERHWTAPHAPYPRGVGGKDHPELFETTSPPPSPIRERRF